MTTVRLPALADLPLITLTGGAGLVVQVHENGVPAAFRLGSVLINAFIPEYLQANRFNHEEKRPRKLLVKKKDLARFSQEVERAGNTIVPLKLYFNEQGRAKILIGVGKGKKSYDKRETEKNRDWNREKSRLLKHG